MFEKVNPAHPDKIADRIAGALVGRAYKYKIEAVGGFEKFAEWGLVRAGMMAVRSCIGAGDRMRRVHERN